MRFDELNENNYMLFAIKFYDNPHALTKEEFEDDLKRIKYVKRLEELIGCSVSLLSTSPEREDTILVKDPFED